MLQCHLSRVSTIAVPCQLCQLSCVYKNTGPCQLCQLSCFFIVNSAVLHVVYRTHALILEQHSQRSWVSSTLTKLPWSNMSATKQYMYLQVWVLLSSSFSLAFCLSFVFFPKFFLFFSASIFLFLLLSVSVSLSATTTAFSFTFCHYLCYCSSRFLCLPLHLSISPVCYYLSASLWLYIFVSLSLCVAISPFLYLFISVYLLSVPGGYRRISLPGIFIWIFLKIILYACTAGKVAPGVCPNYFLSYFRKILFSCPQIQYVVWKHIISHFGKSLKFSQNLWSLSVVAICHIPGTL